MRRRSLTPREDWIRRVEDVGLIYHHTAEGVYWDETACWEFTIKEIEDIERVTADLHRLALRAAQHVIDTKSGSKSLAFRPGLPSSSPMRG